MGNNPIADLRGDELLFGGTLDPTAEIVEAPRGSVYIRAGNSPLALGIFRKLDNGPSTNWQELFTTTTALMEKNFSNALASVIDIDLGSNRIVNLSDPTANQDAATKAYADALVAALSYMNPDFSNAVAAANNIDLGGNSIVNLSNPSALQDAATKNYVDTEISGIPASANLQLSNLSAPTSVNVNLLPNSVSINLGSSSAGFGETYSGLFAINAAGGNNRRGSLTGATSLLTLSSVSSIPVEIVAGAKSGAGASTLSFFGSSVIFNSVANLNSFKITNLAEPTNLQDGATKNYVDNQVSAIPASANTSLSNLDTTSINQTLLPDTADTKQIGSATLRWVNVFAFSSRYYNGSSTLYGEVRPSTRGFGFLAKEQNNVAIETSDTATLNTGNILLRTGSTSGARGTINFNERSLPSAANGYVWTLQNTTTGEGAWSAAAIGANTNLSNLASPTAINQDLLPGTADSLRLGDATNRWTYVSAFAYDFYAGSSQLEARMQAVSSQFSIVTSNANSILIKTENGGVSNSPNISIESGTSDATRGSVTLNGGSVSIDSDNESLFNVAGLKIHSSKNNYAGNANWWGANLPGIVIDGKNSAATTAFGAGLFLDSDPNSCYLLIATSEANSASQTNDVNIFTGLNQGSGASGGVYLYSGNTVDGMSGGTDIRSGNSTNGQSGTMSILTGSGGTNSGGIDIFTGTASTGNSGHIGITTGSAFGGSKGDLNVNVKKPNFNLCDEGLRLPFLTSDPATLVNGDIWYNSTSNQLKAYVNSAVVIIA